jgi:molybdate transport system substrate-binding protein
MKMMARLVAACLAMAVTACGGEAADPAATGAPEPIVVAAASSLTDVMEEIGALYAAEGHPEPRFSFAATSELVRQIEQGAQVDVFVSADTDWMNYLAEKQLIEPGSRRNVASNTLVLIAPAGRGFDIQMGPGMNLRAALGDGRIAIANPDGVPAGKYARDALQSFGAWDALEGVIGPNRECPRRPALRRGWRGRRWHRLRDGRAGCGREGRHCWPLPSVVAPTNPLSCRADLRGRCSRGGCLPGIP